MALTQAQTNGLEAAILAHLIAEGERFVCTVIAFKDEAKHDGNDVLVVIGAVLAKAWTFVHQDFNKAVLEESILDYLVAKGKRLWRTAMAFTEEGGGDQYNLVRDAVLEKTWALVHHGLVNEANDKAFFDAIASGDLAEVQLYVCVGVDVEALRYYPRENGSSPLFAAASDNHLEIVQFFVELGHDKDLARVNGMTPLAIAAENGHFPVVQYLVDKGADKEKAAGNHTTPLYIAARSGHFAVVQYLAEQVHSYSIYSPLCRPLSYPHPYLLSIGPHGAGLGQGEERRQRRNPLVQSCAKGPFGGGAVPGGAGRGQREERQQWQDPPHDGLSQRARGRGGVPAGPGMPPGPHRAGRLHFSSLGRLPRSRRRRPAPLPLGGEARRP